MRRSSGLYFALFVLLMSCGDDSSKEKTSNTCTDCKVEPGSAEVSIGGLSADLIEGGTPVTVPIKLKRAPMDDVTLNIVSLNQAQVIADPAELLFTSTNWNSTQLLTLTTVDDTEVTGDRDVEIEFSLLSEDSSFSNKTVNALVVTVLEDDETPSFKIKNDDDFMVAEAGATTLEITLSAQPSGEVRVPVSPADDSQIQIDVELLSFDTLNWNIAQEILVVGIDDEEADGDQAVNIVLGPTNSTDELFNQLPAQEVSIVVVDGVCGNSVVDGDEPCEPGPNEQTTCPYGESSCTYCTDTCESKAGTSSGECGDGTLQIAGGEECDEATERCAYGEMSCQTCSAQCRYTAGELAGYCGDGVLQNAQEDCDPALSACCNQNCQLDTNECVPDCLVISEYWDGSVDDKAVEIYNCDSSPVNMTGLRMCIIRNADTTCSGSFGYSGTIGPGETKTLCHNNLTHAQGSRCDFRTSTTAEFNGDDRLLLFFDLDGNQTFNSGDARIDAFGETAVRDALQPWKDKLYSRCNFAAYSGIPSFSLASYWSETIEFNYSNMMNGFGFAPTEPCF